MITSNYFFDLEQNFEYVSDSKLWDDIFSNPVPKDFKDPTKGYINLSSYFYIKNCFYKTERGIKQRKFLAPKRKFYSEENLDSGSQLVTLCDFLNRFNRPYRDCYVNVRNHPSMAINPYYHPVDIYYRNPQLPIVNKDKQMLRLSLNDSLFSELHEYLFGTKIEKSKVPEPAQLDFSSRCFYGFVLHY